MPIRKVTVCLSDSWVRTRQAVIVGPEDIRDTLVPSCRSGQDASFDRTLSTKAAAFGAGSRPTVSVMPKDAARWPPGTRKDRVAACLQPRPWKLLWSQPVAATLRSACFGVVPTQGFTTPAAGGRSNSLSIIGNVPARGAGTFSAFGMAEQ